MRILKHTPMAIKSGFGSFHCYTWLESKMNINLCELCSDNLLNIIVESALASNWISINSSKALCACACLCVYGCVCRGVYVCGYCLCGHLAWRKPRWSTATAAVQFLLYLMRRTHAKLMGASRSPGVHSQTSPYRAGLHLLYNRAAWLITWAN